MKTKGYYDEGGFLDDGASVDPISGNEVPTGSLQEEVRDDIPAQLSEGEFVFPADVVRFIGLSQLMKMRDKAKTGLVDMESEGQIGGSPAPQAMPMEMDMGSMQEEPMDIDAMIDGMEGEGGDSLGFAAGGVATYASLMGHEFGSVPTTKNAVYINAAGNKVFIPIVEGEPAYAPPEGYELVVDEADTEVVETPEEELIEAAESREAQGESREDRQRNAEEISSSERLGRNRYKELQKIADYGNSQIGIDALWDEMTGQEKSIYQDRFKEDQSWLDGTLTKGMSPADRMMLAVQTSNTINAGKGQAFNKSQDSMYSDKPLDVKKLIKVIGGALLGGIPGMLTAAEVGKLGIDSAEVKAAARKFVLSGLGQGSGRKGDESIQPSNYTQPTEYNQKYWQNFVGASTAEINAEKLRIARETGKGAYGAELTATEIQELNKIARDQDLVDKKNRTIVERDRKNAYNTKQEKIEGILSKGNTGNKNDNDWEENIRYDEETKVVQDILDDEDRRQRSQTTINNDKPDNNNGSTSVGNPFGYKDDQQNSGRFDDKPSTSPVASSTSNDDDDDSESTSGGNPFGYMNQGGLASKKKQPIKKMRKDPTSGLAAKKKSKQNAKAKKGALAAKRT